MGPALYYRRSALLAFSSRRVLVVLASVVALGVVLAGAVAFASPGNAADHKTEKGRTLTVVIKSREAVVVDAGDRGLSHGDARVVNAPLYDESGKEKVGRVKPLPEAPGPLLSVLEAFSIIGGWSHPRVPECYRPKSRRMNRRTLVAVPPLPSSARCSLPSCACSRRFSEETAGRPGTSSRP
jgi:hypothetical protein